MSAEMPPRDASLLAIGGGAHGRRGPWARYADPDGYVLVPAIRPVQFFEAATLGELSGLPEDPPRYRVARVLLPGWRVPFWAAVHVPWPRRTWNLDEQLGLDPGTILPGSPGIT